MDLHAIHAWFWEPQLGLGTLASPCFGEQRLASYNPSGMGIPYLSGNSILSGCSVLDLQSIQMLLLPATAATYQPPGTPSAVALTTALAKPWD